MLTTPSPVHCRLTVIGRLRPPPPPPPPANFVGLSAVTGVAKPGHDSAAVRVVLSDAVCRSLLTLKPASGMTKHPNPPMPVEGSNSEYWTIVLNMTVRGPFGCIGLKELKPWLTETLTNGPLPPFWSPKVALAAVLEKVDLPGPKPPPAARAAAARAREPQRTREKTRTMRRTIIGCTPLQDETPCVSSSALSWPSPPPPPTEIPMVG